MNVVLEEQQNCEVLLTVEVPGDRVDSEWKNVADKFAKIAKLPGFRPGKAPRHLVESKYAREIREELTDSLLRSSMSEAIKEKGLRVLGVSKVENVDLGADRILRYQATIITSPDFELPEYEGVEIELAEPAVSDEDLERTLTQLREPHASYEAVEGRPLATGDYAVVTYETSLDGKPLKEVLPSTPPMLQGRQNFWVEVAPHSFLEGFSDHLVGMNSGDSKTFSLSLRQDFPLEDLRGKELGFSVTLHDIQKKILPDWNDELAGKIAPGKTVQDLCDTVRDNMEKMAKQRFEESKRGMLLNKLLEKVTCDLPTSLVQQQMTDILRDIVEENQGRGVSEDELREHQEEIVGAARQSAEQRVRSRFLLLRIAEKEKLRVEEQDLLARVYALSQRYDIPIKKLISDLRKRDGIEPMKEDILASKALDLLATKAMVKPPKN